MKVKGIIIEDFVNYKKPCMTIEFPYCAFKCDKENGTQLCQNYALQFEDNIEISNDRIVDFYINNEITKAIVFQGLEPFFNKEIMYDLIKSFREKTNDDIVIYTGYYPNEIDKEVLKSITDFGNIIIKFGRYIPDSKSRYDDVLGVTLVSENQFTIRY